MIIKDLVVVTMTRSFFCFFIYMVLLKHVIIYNIMKLNYIKCQLGGMQ